MDSSTEAQILEVIRKGLPAEVGDTLRKELERIPQLVRDLEKLQSSVASLQRENAILVQKCAELEQLNLSYKGVETARLAVEKRERDLELALLRNQLESSNNVNQRIMSFVDALMRNPTFREKTFITTGTNYNSSGGSSIFETGRDITKTVE